MSQAGDSDGKVIQRLNDNEGAFARLTPDAVASQLPRLQVGMVVDFLTSCATNACVITMPPMACVLICSISGCSLATCVSGREMD